MAIERIKYRPEGGRARSVLLENPRESSIFGAPVIMGTRVDQEGAPIAPDTAACREGDAGGAVIQMIETALIVDRTPMVIDHQYGWLVPDGTATQQQEQRT